MFRILSKGSLHAIEMQWICTNDADGQTVKSKEELQYILEMLFMYGTKVVLRGPSVETVAYYTLQYFMDISEVGPEPSDVENVIKGSLQTFYEDSGLDVNTQLMDIHKAEGDMARLPIWAAYHSKSKHSDKCSYLSMSTFRKEIDYAVRSNRYNDIIVTLNRGRILNTTERIRLFKSVPEVVFIPEDTVDIGANAFKDCSTIKNVNIPEGVEFIGANAFRSATALTQLIVPNSVTRIDHDAFRNCWYLIDITIPNSVKHVGQTVFKGCGNANGQSLPVSFKLGRIIESVRMIDLIDIPGLPRVEDVTILEGVSAIASKGFEDCTNLQDVSMPLSMRVIGSEAFRNCSSLTNLIIGAGVMQIAELAFSGCTSLKTIRIPSSVVSIGSDTFHSCSNLQSITVDSNNSCYSSKDGVLFNKNRTTLIKYPMANERTDYIIPNTITNIGDFTFSNCENLTAVTIPNSVTNIGEGAFRECRNLTRISMSSNVISIGKEAFYECSKLDTISIPVGVESIGDRAFYICRFLRGLVIPKTVKRIGSEAFSGCRINNFVTIHSDSKGDTTIGEKAFYSCPRLAVVRIGQYVTSIGDRAFASCMDLTHIIVNAENLYYSAEAGVLFDKDKTELIQYPIGNTGTSYTIPNSAVHIGSFAFENCTSLTTVTIPNSVTSIGDSAFYSCENLTEVIVPNSVTSIGDSAFYNCENLGNVVIGGINTQIASNAFIKCINLATLHVPAGYDASHLELPDNTRVIYDNS